MNRKDFLAEAGRSVLGLLSLPTVAAISGCGAQQEPLAVPLAVLPVVVGGSCFLSAYALLRQEHLGASTSV